MTSFSAFLLIQILGTALCAQDWAYEEGIDGALGPKEWKNAYEFCGEPDQSPVNIEKKDVQRRGGVGAIEYKSLQKHFSNADLTNNGLYLLLKSDDMSEVTFKRRRDLYTYQLAEIRYHWGQNDSVGSEYTFSGKSYPLEMQLIFYSTNFDSLEDSMEEGYGLAIVAVEFEIASEDNENISDVVDALGSIQEVGTTKTIEKTKSSFGQVLPANRNSFYFYEGTMTSPPCAAAQWHIYMATLTISSNQLEKFRQLNAKYGGKLTNTDRPIQPLGFNDVTYNSY